MKIIMCNPVVSGLRSERAEKFFQYCKNLLDQYITDIVYFENVFQIRQFYADYDNNRLILVYFVNERNEYIQELNQMIERCRHADSVIWPVAMDRENRMPQKSIRELQSFDVHAFMENRRLYSENLRTVAEILARKIIGQALPALYFAESRYFICHRRTDGEAVAAKLADEINMLERRDKMYRDVVEVKVGEEAQKDIDHALYESDIVVFLQTPDAGNSEYIKKELYFALLHDIPILWIGIDGADEGEFRFLPIEHQHVLFKSREFENVKKLEKIANRIEEMCFAMIMNHSGNVFDCIEELKGLAAEKEIEIEKDIRHDLAFYIELKKKRKPLFESQFLRQYVQYYGRMPKECERANWSADVFIWQSKGVNVNSAAYVSSRCQHREVNEYIFEDNYYDYILFLEKQLGAAYCKKNKKVIISGAFPDCDDIYKQSLNQALIIYAKEIIRRGYTLVFGAHPTFQEIIMQIGEQYSPDSRESVEMYMSAHWQQEHDVHELKERVNLIITPEGENLQESLRIMRNKMIAESKAELIICLGGKIKTDRAEQGIDEEISIARKEGLPVYLVGSVGGRSSQYANELCASGKWDEINPAGQELNLSLLYELNHRKMIREILETIKQD